MNSKDKTNLIKYCKKTLPRNSEILFLGPEINVDNFMDKDNYFCIYLPPSSEMLLANKLVEGQKPNSNVFFYSIQEFLKCSETNPTLHNKYTNLFIDLDRSDYIIKHTMMEIICKNRNMLIDTKKNDFFKKLEYISIDLDRAFLECFKNISESYRYCQLNEIQIQAIEKYDQNNFKHVDDAKELLNSLCSKGFQWEGIYHQGFVESFILSLYSGITLEDGEDFEFSDMDLDDFC